MQSDFHFYCIYGLCRAAGFGPEHARIIAYSSQHTDDAKYDHALEFQNGGRFQQALTAHRYLHTRVLGKPTCYQIWVPFHFLPGNVGADFFERMLTRPGGDIARKVIDDLLESRSRPYLLHRLGLLLHTYADTWSHQNFAGLQKEELNDVIGMKVEGESKLSLANYFDRLKQLVLEYVAPMMGHSQAGSIPDEPFRHWKYENPSGTIFEISNLDRTLDAARNCYRLLLRFLLQFPACGSGKSVPWQEMTAKVGELFGTAGELADRETRWKDAVSGGEFGPKLEKGDNHPNYDDREWFREAVEVTKRSSGEDQYKRRPGFEASNWKYFHDAAAYHRFVVLHEVLPEQGIICG